MTTTPAGYTYDEELPPSPVSTQQLGNLLTDVMWSEDDAAALRTAGQILKPQVSQILDVWYDFIGSTRHLVEVEVARAQVDDPLLEAPAHAGEVVGVRPSVGAGEDEQWLAYQEQIALRHHPTKKNATDGVSSPMSHVPMSHMMALVVPVTLTIRDFLANGESDPQRLEAMQQAWFKAVTVSLVLWARPYAADLW